MSSVRDCEGMIVGACAALAVMGWGRLASGSLGSTGGVMLAKGKEYFFLNLYIVKLNQGTWSGGISAILAKPPGENH